MKRIILSTVLMLGSMALMAQQKHPKQREPLEKQPKVETKEVNVKVPIIMGKPIFFYSVPLEPHDTIATLIRANGAQTVMQMAEKVVADAYHDYQKFDAVIMSGRKCERVYVIKFKTDSVQAPK